MKTNEHLEEIAKTCFNAEDYTIFKKMSITSCRKKRYVYLIQIYPSGYWVSVIIYEDDSHTYRVEGYQELAIKDFETYCIEATIF